MQEEGLSVKPILSFFFVTTHFEEFWMEFTLAGFEHGFEHSTMSAPCKNLLQTMWLYIWISLPGDWGMASFIKTILTDLAVLSASKIVQWIRILCKINIGWYILHCSVCIYSAKIYILFPIIPPTISIYNIPNLFAGHWGRWKTSEGHSMLSRQSGIGCSFVSIDMAEGCRYVFVRNKQAQVES